ncbi:hypothetical protein COE56_28945 [Bacillus anthracis]|nr:hypothetical protein COE56_28945 [Bacillus anthracis]
MKMQCKKMREELVSMMDEKIENYDVGALKQHTKALLQDLKLFEDTVNRLHAKSPTIGGSIEETRRVLAISINSKFKEFLLLCQKENQKIVELPKFTVIAASHLQFLRFIEANGKGSKIKMDAETWRTNFVDAIPKLTDNYITYVQDMYEKGIQRFNDKMDAITTHSYNENENLAYLEGLVHKLENLDSTRKEMQENIDKLNQAKNDYQKYKDILSAKNDYIATTTNNLAFNMEVLTGWKQEGKSWYMVDKNNRKRTGWFSEYGQKYYLSPEKTEKFKKGEMVTDKVDIEGTGKTYYFNPEQGKKRELMMTGWVQDGAKKYYASSKNWNGHTFDKGQLMTGWSRVNDRYGSLDGTGIVKDSKWHYYHQYVNKNGAMQQ